jgi:arylsulfatase A-like enzyme
VKSAIRGILALAWCAALVGTSVGAVEALRDAFQERWVREFQAGSSAPWSERASAFAQRTAIEGAGGAALGLLLGVCALGGAALLCRRAGAHERASRFQRAGACGLVVAAGFTAWVTYGAWLAGEALAFLQPGPLALLDLVGIAACVAGFGLAAVLVARIPIAPRGAPLAAALGAVLAVAFQAWLVLRCAHSLPWPAKSAPALAVYAALMLLSLPLGALLARLVARPVAWAEARLARGRLVPRGVQLALGALWLACAVATLFAFRLSALPAEALYRKLPSSGAPPGPNVVLVTIDTLRADHLGCYGYPRPTSPFLDELAAGGTLFLDPVSPAAWTKPATGTILTGLYPSRHGALYHGSTLQLPDGERTLAEAFRAAGYVTAAFVTNPNIKRVFEFDRGFDQYFDSPVEDTVTLASIRATRFGHVLMSLMRHQFNWNYENDVRGMNEHILAWLDANRDNRFFLYLHYIDPHVPYAPPAEYRRQFEQDHGLVLFDERKRAVGIDLYDGEIRYADDGMRELVDRLRALGIWENTLFALTSDHGEEFLEHGVLGHGFSLYQEVIRVPLIAHGPGVAAGRRVEEPVQVVDLPATLLDLAGTGVAALGDGRSFAAAARDGDWDGGGPIFLENEFGTEHHDRRSFVLTGVREGGYKLVLTEANVYFPPESHGGQALYDVAQDPHEGQNLIRSAEHAALVESLLSKLREHSRFLQDTGFRDVRPAALSAEVERSLKALGY